MEASAGSRGCRGTRCSGSECHARIVRRHRPARPAVWSRFSCGAAGVRHPGVRHTLGGGTRGHVHAGRMLTLHRDKAGLCRPPCRVPRLVGQRQQGCVAPEGPLSPRLARLLWRDCRGVRTESTRDFWRVLYCLVKSLSWMACSFMRLLVNLVPSLRVSTTMYLAFSLLRSSFSCTERAQISVLHSQGAEIALETAARVAAVAATGRERGCVHFEALMPQGACSDLPFERRLASHGFLLCGDLSQLLHCPVRAGVTVIVTSRYCAGLHADREQVLTHPAPYTEGLSV